ncbi:FUSC family protein [Terriglobus roseus]|uniref:Fusaric acid resistance protein-like n=1 Tax=Terriglobus roseus TaxID=392734 RepID=A0A1G7G9K4_9BACT|nr:FUSC family protein [Terriglobus roseus]SDE84791.1 Fusaric acid resistance protein-like [Terriglobus roseus]
MKTERPFTQRIQDIVSHRENGIRKGARLILAYALAVGLSLLSAHNIHPSLASPAALSLCSGLALWACVSESAVDKRTSLQHAALLVTIGTVTAALLFSSTKYLHYGQHSFTELPLVLGAFCVAGLRVYGDLATGIGSQIYIGLLLAQSNIANFSWTGDGPWIFLIALTAATLPQLLLHGDMEITRGHEIHQTESAAQPMWLNAFLLGLQSAIPAILILMLAPVFHLREPSWAITAAAYVVSAYSLGTADRIRRRIVGTVIGVPLGLLFLVFGTKEHLILWGGVAIGMLIYALSLPERYDIACAAYAFVLMLTMIASGERSVSLLASRVWETLLGCGLAALTMTGMSWLKRKPAGWLQPEAL